MDFGGRYRTASMLSINLSVIDKIWFFPSECEYSSTCVVEAKSFLTYITTPVETRPSTNKYLLTFTRQAVSTCLYSGFGLYSVCGLFVQCVWFVCTVCVVCLYSGFGLYSVCGLFVQWFWFVQCV